MHDHCHPRNPFTPVTGKCVVLSALLFLAGPGFGQNANLISNGNFSDGATGWSLGTAGQIDPKVYKTPEITNDATDTNSLKIRSSGLWETVGSARAKVAPNVDYRIAAWLKLADAHQTHVKFNWLDATGKLIATEFLCTGQNGTRDWFELAGIFKAPATAAFLELTFLSGGQPERPGTLWVDRVEVETWAAPSTSNAAWRQAIDARYGSSGIAAPMTEKVIYYDVRHDGCGVSNSEPLVHFFTARGFAVKNADDLKRWMEEKIAAGADGTVCILAMGVIPDLVCENKKSPTFKKYIESGGRVVWIGDVPLFYLSHTDRAISDCGWDVDVLGYRHGPWNSQKPGIMTAAGKKWGMERPGDSAVRPVIKDSVTLVFSEQPGTTLACSYFINYNARFPYSGFLRFFGTFNYDGGDDSLNRDLYRVALFRGTAITVPDVPAWTAVTEAEKPVVVTTPVGNYNRGDKIKITVAARMIAQAKTMSLTLLDGDKLLERFELPVKASQEMTLETADLAPARDYVLRAEAIGQNGKTAAGTRRFYLAPVKTAKLPVGMYGFGEGSTQAKTEIILKDLAGHLGEGGLISLYLGNNYSYMADQAVRYGLKVVGGSGSYYEAALPANCHPELHMRLSNGELPLGYHYGRLGDGKAPVCMGNPVNREHINEFLKRDIARFTGYPGFFNRFFVSDDGGMFGYPGTNQLVCYCPYCKAKFKELTGHDAPLAAAVDILRNKGVVDDQDTWYRWMRFRTGTVYGDWNRSMRQAAETVSPGIKIAPLPAGMAGSPVLHAPWALNPPDNYAGTGISSYYYYPNRNVPATCQLVYGELARMGNRQNELWPMPQSSDYEHLLSDPDFHAALVKNQYFHLLGAGSSAIVYFSYPLMPGTKAWEEFKTFAPLGVTFGPLLRNSPKSPRHVAVLASFCDTAYRWCKSDGSAPNYEALYLDLRKNNLQADFVSDEEIGAGILKNYRVLVVGNDNYMLRSVQGKIQAFAAGGGTVLLDKASKLAIPGAKLTDVPQLPAAARVVAPQSIAINAQTIIASEFNAGDARLFILANVAIDQPAAGTVSVPGYVLYDLRAGGKIANGARVTLAPGDGTLIFAVPVAPAAIVAQADAGGITVTVAGDDGNVIHAAFPIKVTVFQPDGKEAAAYSDTYVTANGKLVIKPFLARNDPKGKWTAEIQELASGVKTKLEFVAK